MTKEHSRLKLPRGMHSPNAESTMKHKNSKRGRRYAEQRTKHRHTPSHYFLRSYLSCVSGEYGKETRCNKELHLVSLLVDALVIAFYLKLSCCDTASFSFCEDNIFFFTVWGSGSLRIKNTTVAIYGDIAY